MMGNAIGWVGVGFLFGFGTGMAVLAVEQARRTRQLWAVVQAYEARIVQILGKQIR